MKRSVFLSGAILLCIHVPSGAEINKCEIDGRTVYTDLACPDGTADALDLPPLITVPAPEAEIYPETMDKPTVKKPYRSNKWHEGHEGYAEALRISRRHKARIFIYARTDWCPYCRQFEERLLPTPEVTDTLAGYVKVRINPEDSDEDMELLKSWGGAGFPTLWVQGPTQAKPERGPGPFLKSKKLMDTSYFTRLYFVGLKNVPLDAIVP